MICWCLSNQRDLPQPLFLYFPQNTHTSQLKLGDLKPEEVTHVYHPGLRRLGQEGPQVKASLGYIVRFYTGVMEAVNAEPLTPMVGAECPVA